MATRAKTSRSQNRGSAAVRSRANRRAAPRRPNAVASIVRLTAGTLSLGYDELIARIATIPPGGPARPMPNAARARADLTVADLVIGIAIASATRANGLIAETRKRGQGVASTLDGLAAVPVIRLLTTPMRTRLERYRATARKLAALGHDEHLEGRRMVMHLIEDTASASVRDISASAIKEVSHSPEVAELVRTQSASLASDTILEVREASEQADDRIERRVRSWLRLVRPDEVETQPTAGGGPAA